jgi:hypothetical protein
MRRDPNEQRLLVHRITGGAARLGGLEVYARPLCRPSAKTAEALSAKISSARRGSRGRVSQLKNPWAGSSSLLVGNTFLAEAGSG